MMENNTLVLDMLEWLACEPRPYSDVMEAWRTSCPRLTVWEDAVDEHFVGRTNAGGGAWIELTEKGRAFLLEHRPQHATR